VTTFVSEPDAPWLSVTSRGSCGSLEAEVGVRRRERALARTTALEGDDPSPNRSCTTRAVIIGIAERRTQTVERSEHHKLVGPASTVGGRLTVTLFEMAFVAPWLSVTVR